MNPLSSHPPRTPRSSLAFGYNSDTALTTHEDTKPELSIDTNGTDVDEDDIHSHPQNARVSKEEIWREVVKSSKGRDKTLVIDISLRHSDLN
jgi:hypothetical protein